VDRTFLHLPEIEPPFFRDPARNLVTTSKIPNLYAITPSILQKDRCFGGIHRLCLQGRSICLLLLHISFFLGSNLISKHGGDKFLRNVSLSKIRGITNRKENLASNTVTIVTELHCSLCELSKVYRHNDYKIST
jgi:hypothetical protein